MRDFDVPCFVLQASAIRAVSLGEGRLGNALDILHRYNTIAKGKVYRYIRLQY